MVRSDVHLSTASHKNSAACLIATADQRHSGVPHLCWLPSVGPAHPSSIFYKMKNAHVASATAIIADTSIIVMSWARATIAILLATEAA